MNTCEAYTCNGKSYNSANSKPYTEQPLRRKPRIPISTCPLLQTTGPDQDRYPPDFGLLQSAPSLMPRFNTPKLGQATVCVAPVRLLISAAPPTSLQRIPGAQPCRSPALRECPAVESRLAETNQTVRRRVSQRPSLSLPKQDDTPRTRPWRDQKKHTTVALTFHDSNHAS